MKILQISSSIALALMLSNNVFGQKVEHVGQQKTVGQNADPHIKLDTLTITKNFEGMGPVDRVNGEITVLDGKIYAAIIKNNALAIRHDNNLTAPFFVWANVQKWKKYRVEEALKGISELSTIIEKYAQKSGKSANDTFVFKIMGEVESLNYHVMNKTTDESNTEEAFRKPSVKFSTTGNITLLGFYTQKRGDFTSSEQNFHIHFVSEDKQLSGHVNDIKWNANKVRIEISTK